MLAERVRLLACEARREVVLVAPFIQLRALKAILENVAPSVGIMCYTRWRIDEIAAGVSDVEIWPELDNRGASLFLVNALHAKAFIVDDVALVGSANITAAGLGLGSNCNLELLVEVPRTIAEIARLESDLNLNASKVDEALYEKARRVAIPGSSPGTQQIVIGAPWLPHLRSPEYLFDVYTGSSDVPTAASETAAADLAALAIPAGLHREEFEAAVALCLLQAPLIARVDSLLCKPRRFGEIAAFIATQVEFSQESDADAAWQTAMRWLRHFIPSRYVLSVPNVSEVMIRRDALDLALGRRDDT